MPPNVIPSAALSWWTFFLAAALSLPCAAQLAPYEVFCVEFTDKHASPYTLLRPHDFLSARSIERRRTQGIALDEYDLPVDPAYLRSIAAAGGEIRLVSRWLNAAAVYAPDSLTRARIDSLPFVRRIYPLGYRRLPQKEKNFPRVVRDTSKARADRYGYGANQAFMLDMPYFHELGYRGAGIHVAIFDGGFENVYRMPAFDTLFARHQILGTRDFVECDEYVYEDSGHGTDVLACMAANMPFRLIGTAPDASYYLFKTEDTKGEFWIEEFNWVAAAEYADSLGVDVINSSLGYTGFRDTMMNYEYSRDLDGETSIASRGADIAVFKGIIVVNSAGNEGNKKWHYIGTPADARNVIAAAATDADGKKALFSSHGPSADGRIKPNLAAQGKDTYVASMLGLAVKTTSGTSFSAPVLAGAIASCRQALPNLPALQFKHLLEIHASQGENPDTLLGYGIPRFVRSWTYAMPHAWVFITPRADMHNRRMLPPNEDFTLWVQMPQRDSVDVEIYDPLGKLVFQTQRHYTPEFLDLCAVKIPSKTWTRGVYALRVRTQGRTRFLSLWK